mgnify:CR=1 FL=1
MEERFFFCSYFIYIYCLVCAEPYRTVFLLDFFGLLFRLETATPDAGRNICPLFLHLGKKAQFGGFDVLGDGQLN